MFLSILEAGDRDRNSLSGKININPKTRETEKTKMKIIKLALLGATVLFGLAAWSQEFPRYEVNVDYSYFRYNPSHAFSQNGHSLNGAGGSIDVNLNSYLGIKMELNGYGSQGFNFNIPSPILTTRGVIPAGFFHANGNMFTYLFGPQIKFRAPKFQPFGQILFGGAHSNVYGNLFTASGSTGAAPSGNGFSMAVGGGLDIPVTHMIAIRPVQLDYVLTRFNNSVTGNQANFRYQAGVTFNFGGAK
jgi:hypothetical protein